ncbi:MAG: DNA polymerase III subunit alpha, partial [Nocardioides sp.]|nr:DNA polymerase III subunit alpha [Nocardioides sp.]
RAARAGRGRGLASGRRPLPATQRATDAATRNSSDPVTRDAEPVIRGGVWGQAAAQSRATAAPRPVDSVQLTLALGDEPAEGEVTGLPELTGEERMKAELEILGLDVSRHVIDGYADFLDALGVTRSRDLLARRSKAELLVAGVKVATQTPPIRTGRRVIFLTLDDATGPVDATFFEDAQGPYAAAVFGSWLLLVRGELRRTGRRGVSLRATGAWSLPDLMARWQQAPTSADGLAEVREAMRTVPAGFGDPAAPEQRRVLVHTSGFQMSPYSDIKPAGENTRDVARKLWHRSPGSPG